MLLRIAPGDPTRSTILGENAGTAGLSEDKGALAENKSLRESLHLDKPKLVGFVLWLKDIVIHGDLGKSASVDPGRPVAGIILERLPVTLSLNFWAILFVYMFAIPIGLKAALSPDSPFDRFMTFLLFFMYSVPVFWMSLTLQANFCVGGRFPLFPDRGLAVLNTEGLYTWQILWRTALHYALPVFCLSYAGFAGLSRFARTGMIEVIHQDYIRTARAKGLPEGVVILKHAFRNSMITLITLFAGLLPGLVAGSIIIEYIFSIPGMGALSINALTSRDIPLLMALFGFGGVLTLLGILLSDILYVLVDPRISFEKRS